MKRSVLNLSQLWAILCPVFHPFYYRGLFIFIFIGSFYFSYSQSKALDGSLIIQYKPGHPANIIHPSLALGAGIDGHQFGENQKMFSPKNIKAMLSAGLKSLTYRLRTELGEEAWHWNPMGSWSEKGKNQGYWISDSSPDKPIQLSYGYKLPRRGSTFDQADNTGYSRIDDGEDSTYWKSNPYLDHRFTGEPDSLHPQWIALDLGKTRMVNFLKIHWADPYAIRFYLEYADSSESDMSKSMKIISPYREGYWKPLPQGLIQNKKGGVEIVEFQKPIPVRLIRLVCTKSSGTAIEGSHDPRDSAGYAIRELELGLKEDAKFTDYLVHGKSNALQTPIFVSTTDSWHRSSDLDLDTEQPGLDFIFQSKINRGLPVLYPLPIVYDNPENAMAQVRYMEKMHYPVKEWELGEEPDGQYISPQDFASLYSSLAKKILFHRKYYRVGGPSFQSLDEPFSTTDNIFMQKTWIQNFIKALKKKGDLSLFQFFSFEWYPFDNICQPQPFPLVSESLRLKNAYGAMKEVLPPFIPIYISEYGYSVSAAEPEVRMDGALFNADLVGQFLSMGGNKAFLYGYEPGYLNNETGCSWGNLMLFGLNNKGEIDYSTGLYQSARLYSEKWADPRYHSLSLFPCEVHMKDSNNKGFLTAYSLKKPNGTWALMVINKDSSRIFNMAMKIYHTQMKKNIPWKGNIEKYQYSPVQYEWLANGPSGRPVKNQIPLKAKVKIQEIMSFPPYSITVMDQK